MSKSFYAPLEYNQQNRSFYLADSFFDDLRKNLPNIVKQKELENIVNGFYDILRNDSDIFELAKSYKESLSKVSRGSLINFIRSYPYLLHYILISKNHYLNDNNDTLILEITNNDGVLLQLRFLSTGIVEFVSMDSDDILDGENLMYILKGTISTSNKLNRSYKIKRLLQVLDIPKHYSINKQEEYLLYLFEGYSDLNKDSILEISNFRNRDETVKDLSIIYKC